MVEELQAQAAAKREEGDERGEMQWSNVSGNVFYRQGRHEEAVVVFERALAISRRVLSEDDKRRGAYMCNLAATHCALGRHEDARAWRRSY